MDKFVIIKSSRSCGRVKETDAYNGIVYVKRSEAKSNAKQLSEVNPVGFFVVEVGKKHPESIRDYYCNGEKRQIPHR